MREIAIWLGLRSDELAVDAMLNPAASPFARFGPEDSGVTGGSDSGFLSDPAPHEVELPDTVDPPPKWSEEPHVWKMVVDLANELGYR